MQGILLQSCESKKAGENVLSSHGCAVPTVLSCSSVPNVIIQSLRWRCRTHVPQANKEAKKEAGRNVFSGLCYWSVLLSCPHSTHCESRTGRNQYKTQVSAAQSRPTSAKWIDEGSSSFQVSVCCQQQGTMVGVQAGSAGRVMGSKEQQCVAGGV